MDLDSLLDDINVTVIKKVSTLPVDLESNFEDRLSITFIAHREVFEMTHEINADLDGVEGVGNLAPPGSVFDGVALMCKDLFDDLANFSPDYLWHVGIIREKSQENMQMEMSRAASEIDIDYFLIPDQIYYMILIFDAQYHTYYFANIFGYQRIE